MSESNQCLRESFEQRHISPDENHFYHYGVSLIPPGVEPIPGQPRRSRLLSSASCGRTRCTHCAVKFSAPWKETLSGLRSPIRVERAHIICNTKDCSTLSRM